MSNYANKLSSIEEKKQKLILEEAKILEKRKSEIGSLAEKFNLLTLSDETIIGVFSEVKLSMENNKQKINDWAEHGRKYIKPKRNTAKTEKNT